MCKVTPYWGRFASLLSPLLATTALGQTLDTSIAPPSSETAALEEVVITSQKRSENLQAASVAVDVVRPDDLERNGINNAIDLQQLVPALRFVNSDQMTASIRGLGTADDNEGVDSDVAYSQDGIYLAHPPALTPVLFDLQRVETVLGPQGTLYGRNSNAGVINFITNDPTPELGGFARAGVGNYAAWNTEGALNVPLNKDLAVRISEGTEYHGPYADDRTNWARSIAGRVKVLYHPGNDLNVLLTVDGARQQLDPQITAMCPPGLTDISACNGVPYVPWSGYAPQALGMYNRDSIFGASARIQYDLGWSSLTALTGYKQYRLDTDTGPAWFGGFDHFDYRHDSQDKFITQEVRLNSRDDSPIKWVGGVYFSNETQTGRVSFNFHRDVAYPLPPDFYAAYPITDSLARSYATFGDVTVPVFTPSIRLRAGVRYTYESKFQAGLLQNGIAGGPLFENVPNQATEIQRRPTWKAGLDWDVTPANLLYTTVSTGFKSGGINILPAAASDFAVYKPETITAVEVGSKNRFLDNRLQVNVAAFHYDYHNYQTYFFWTPNVNAPPSLAGQTLFPTVNSQRATFEGGEFNVAYRLTQNDIVDFGLNYLHNIYDEFVIPLPYIQTVDLSGTEAYLAPKTTFSVGYEHDFTLPNGATLRLSGHSQIVSSQIAQGQYTDDHGLTRIYRDPAYHKTGLNVSYITGDGNWTVTAFVRNIENVAVITSLAGSYPVVQNLGQVDVHEDQPRTFGFNIRRDF
jgi:iron complex outermembrane receptor protein